VTARTTAFGERHSIDWLTYNPLQMLQYHRMALADAPAVVTAVLETFPERRSIADVGCGSGAFAAEFQRRGRSVVACEHAVGGRLVARLQRVEVSRFDLDRVPPATLLGDLQLAYCFEVAEHCTPAQGERLVEFLANLAPVVVFSAAQPGQGGLGHINEQDPGYWIDAFGRHGAVLAESETENLRQKFAGAGLEAPWFAANALVFLAPTEAAATAASVEYGASE
jgi:SAM-dependent methyltransferase